MKVCEECNGKGVDMSEQTNSPALPLLSGQKKYFFKRIKTITDVQSEIERVGADGLVNLGFHCGCHKSRLAKCGDLNSDCTPAKEIRPDYFEPIMCGK